jgi:hypothetical protein
MMSGVDVMNNAADSAGRSSNNERQICTRFQNCCTVDLAMNQQACNTAVKAKESTKQQSLLEKCDGAVDV